MFGYFDYDHPLFRPPSEARSLIFQVTIGCSQNTCRFCGMYKMKTFRVRRPEEIYAEIDCIPLGHRGLVQRVFLGDGDGLVCPQRDLVRVLDRLDETFPNLARVGAYASPHSLKGKTREELLELRQRKLTILYFGLESGDPQTLELAAKGYSPEEMFALCCKAQAAGMKLSVTAILGLAGKSRSREHALATASWINELSPRYFSLLTMFHRHNDNYFQLIDPLTNGEVIEEACLVVRNLHPQRTILRSNHVSNILNLAGSYPKDREKIIVQAEAGLKMASSDPDWFRQVPGYGEVF